MINFNLENEIEATNVSVTDVIIWSEKKLKELLGFEFKVWCSPKISTQRLYYNIDETEMTDEQWRLFSNKFNTQDGYTDSNFTKLLNFVFGEATYLIHIKELDSFYIIRDKVKGR